MSEVPETETHLAHADIPQAFVQSVLKRPIYCKFPQGVEICPKLLAHVQAKHPNAIEFNWNEITEITLRLKERAYVLVAPIESAPHRTWIYQV